MISGDRDDTGGDYDDDTDENKDNDNDKLDNCDDDGHYGSLVRSIQTRSPGLDITFRS